MRACLAVLLLAGTAHAQVYKCQEGGKTVFSQAPCAGAGTLVDGTKPLSAAEQARQPLTQKREVERAQREREPEPEPAPAFVPGPLAAPPAATEPAPKRNRSARRAPQGPLQLTNCDGGGCWDTNGGRYTRAAGGMVRQDGKFCVHTGGSNYYCH